MTKKIYVNVFVFLLLHMVAYFCHHLSDSYVDLSDLYVDLSDLYVDLSLIPSVRKKSKHENVNMPS